MTIQLAWDDETQRLITCRVEGRWTWPELEQALSEAVSMMDSVSHPVDFIVDIRQGRLDVGSAVGQIQKAATPETHPNEGIKVVVGANFVVRNLYGVYRTLTRSLGKEQEFIFADSMERARTLIAHSRS